MDYPKRLIEVDLPIKRISAHARREKSIRHGHISTLHIWWARRPLAACRAVICAALWPDPADPICPQAFRDAAARLISEFASKAYRTPTLHATASRESFGQWEGIVKAEEQGIAFDTHDPDHLNRLRFALLDFIADYANWDNSTVPAYLETARSLTAAAHEALGGEPGTRPLVVDPFAGGGSIPLEALRVGADAFASDLNPVAVLLNKVVLEYIPTYGQRLADEVRKWGAWIKERAEKELAELYPRDRDGATPIAYLWARTIQCEGPGCGAEVPLIRSLWLAKRGNNSIAVRLVTDSKATSVEFDIIHRAKASDVAEGTVKRSSATCPCCGYTTPAASVRKQLLASHGGLPNARLIAVRQDDNRSGERTFRKPIHADLLAAKLAVQKYRELAPNTEGMTQLPNEHLPIMSGVFNAPIYGHNTWGSLFSPRQAICLVTLVKFIKDIEAKLKPSADDGFTQATVSCLALALDKLADYNSSLCTLNVTGGRGLLHTFARQALPMVWDFMETNPFNEVGANWCGGIESFFETITHEKCMPFKGSARLASATQNPMPDDSAHCIATDPPYYNAVPYADLSDFFFVWLKRTLRRVLPELFSGDATPKDEECCEMAGWDSDRYPHKDARWFEEQMRLSMAEARRVLRPDGIAVVVFAHKSTAGWETMLSGLIDAGWTITSSWPIDTERPGRLRALNSAVLGSSVHLVCRPRETPDGLLRTAEIGEWRDVLHQLPRRIHEWLPRLAQEGIVGADAIFACLGPALEIFSRHSRVERADGTHVNLREYLEEVWAAVAKEALSLLFKGADASGLEPDARLTAMWLWTLRTDRSETNGNGAKADESEEDTGDDSEPADEEARARSSKASGYVLEFDAARKIAQGLGANLDTSKSVVEVKGQTARLRSVEEREAFLFAPQRSTMPAGPSNRSVEPAPTPKRGRSRRSAAGQQAFFVDEEGRLTAQRGVGPADRIDAVPESNTAADWTAAQTVLDRIHQAMLLFAKGRSDGLKRFLVDDGIGKEDRFWKLAQSLSALYPPGSDEKRWVDGVLGRKKGLGL